MNTERIKQTGHIAAHNIGQVVEEFPRQIRSAGSQELLNNALRHVNAILVHHLLAGSQHTLIHAQHFRPAMQVIGLAVHQPHDVHGAVADVGHHHRAGELPELIESLVVVHQRHQRGIALGEYDAVGQMDAVQHIVEGKPDVRVAHHIAAVIFPLPTCPGRGQTQRQIYIGLSDLLRAQFGSNGSQRQDVEVLVSSLVRVVGLMPLANAIPGVVILKNVAIKKGLGVHRHQARGVDRAGGLHVAVACVHTDDIEIVMLSHDNTSLSHFLCWLLKCCGIPCSCPFCPLHAGSDSAAGLHKYRRFRCFRRRRSCKRYARIGGSFPS